MAEYNPFGSTEAPAASSRKIRRLVTGIDAEGKSCFVDDSIANGRIGHGHPTYVVTDLWRTFETPAINTKDYVDALDTPVASVHPTPNGSVFRILELPPDREWRFDADGNETKPLAFHTTPSVDYAIVLSGEIYAVMDAEERLMQTGDVLVQRGTVHAWSNRSEATCVLAVVLINGTLP